MSININIDYSINVNTKSNRFMFVDVFWDVFDDKVDLKDDEL